LARLRTSRPWRRLRVVHTPHKCGQLPSRCPRCTSRRPRLSNRKPISKSGALAKDNRPGGPIYFLAFQALELYLKAYLLRKGVTLQHVTKKIGHSIEIAIKEAEEKGLRLNLDPGFRQALREFSEAYKRRDFQYRGNREGPVFLPGCLISFVDEVRSKP